MYLVEDVDDVNDLVIDNPDHLSYVTQTTLSMDDTASVINALRQRFPNIHGPKKDDICYATQNRQDAVKSLAQVTDLVLVVGSPNSSNSNRLKEVAERIGAKAYLIDNETEINQEWLKGKEKIGLTAGASAPAELVENVIVKLREWGASSVTNQDGIEENIVFSLPKELQ